MGTSILIVMQINNWNLNRLDKKKEKAILIGLEVEFDGNLSLILNSE
ncbi:hypothetical protein [Psychroserpens burtonensis]|nr:hypothetical protein [Psychroserpens burtonensis]